MGKPIEQLECEIFEWPDRWLVEAAEPDRDYYTFYPPAENEPREIWPHFVDLSAYDTGWCTCRDYRFNILPYLFLDLVHRRQCIHIIAALRAQRLRATRPKPIKPNLQLFIYEQ